VPIYQLPDLTYDHGALEPHISGQIMELHHGKHHAAYVTGANTAHEKLETARSQGDFASITMLEKNLAFHTSGHVLHSLFWANLSPDGGGTPNGDLGKAIDSNFGSFEAFQKQLTEATNTVQGSGWGALAYEPLSGKLIVQQIYDHQGNIAVGTTPLLVIDAWEHAYYLQYKNVRADFVKAVWNIVNWKDVMARFQAASM
jgi:Fe-Mn family superoxide dismutase